MELDCSLAGMVISAVQLISKPTNVTEITRGIQAVKSETTRKLIRPQTGMNTAIQVVLDEIVTVDFFPDANCFFIQVILKTQKPQRPFGDWIT